MRMLSVVLLALCLTGGARAAGPAVTGLDHVSIAVSDLDAAAATYRKLGFTLKPGALHPNGLRNWHAKFIDGTELELISPTTENDALTREYKAFLGAGDGAAFLALYAPLTDSLAEVLDAAKQPYRRQGAIVSLPEKDPLRYLFFGKRNRGPDDLREHFQHANGAEALVAVWLAADDFTAEQRMFKRLGATINEQEVAQPQKNKAPVAHLGKGELVMLPAKEQVVPGRRIVGAVLRTRVLDKLVAYLATQSGDVPPLRTDARGRSLLLPPTMTHGIWLEFREEAR